ncbi:MAG: InlB B-repeat-containing protein [Bacteroidales bacterium]|nr:InlB B-repeat-containing protein [Bacteroidales bacterium]
MTRKLTFLILALFALISGPGWGQTRETKTLTFALTSNPGGWPTENSTTLTNYTYTLDGTAYTFALKNVKCNSGYLMMTSTAVLGLPAIEDYKLTKVVAKNSGSCSTSTKVGISSSSSSASYIPGGAIQTWSTQSSTYTYNLSGTSNNTVYYLYVTNKNAQITELTLTYEGEAAPAAVAAPTFNPAADTYYEDKTIELSAEDGCTIYYTLDNSAPTAESTEYSTPIQLTVPSTTTIKAIAVDGENNSSNVASATYTLKRSQYTPAQLLAEVEPDNQQYTVVFNNETITEFYLYNSQKRGFYIETGEEDFLTYCSGTPTDWEVGGKVSGTVTGTWKTYSNLKEFCPANYDDFSYTQPTQQLPEPTSLTVSNLSMNGATLSWDAVEHASSYTVYVTDADEYEETYTNITENSKVLNDLSAGITYLWTVKAIGDGEIYLDSEESESAEFTTPTTVIYNINFEAQQTGGTIAFDPERAAAGEEVWAMATVSEHYSFTQWNFSPEVTIYEGEITDEIITFIMPASDVTVSATFTEHPKYTVTYAKGGEDVVGDDPETVSYYLNDVVILEENPYTRTGFTFNGWQVKDAEENDVTVDEGMFEMPASNVTVTATWAEKDPATITLMDKGAQYGETINGYVGDNLLATLAAAGVENPTGLDVMPDYEFAGWAQAKNTENPNIATTETTIAGDITLYAVYANTTPGETTWNLVTDASSLAVGDVVVIAASGYDYAMSTTQNTSNRGQFAITKTDSQVTWNNSETDGVQEITLETGNKDNTFAFNVGDGYLYAASSSSNNLKTQDDIDGNASWAISISGNVASIVAQGTNSRNVMQYNQSSELFACYGSASQKALALYKENTTPGTTIYDFEESAKIYTVTYDANGAEGDVPVEAMLFAQGDGYTLASAEGLTKEHHTFAGWKASTDEQTYAVGSTYTFGEASVTFTAQWDEEQKLTISYHTNGVVSSEDVFAGENQLTAPANVPNGYTYVGWAEAPIEDVVQTATYFSSYNVTEDVDLYAVFATIKTNETTDDMTYTLLPDNFGGESYASNDGDKEINNVTLTIKDVYKNSSTIQMKASSGSLNNKYALGQKITSVVVDVKTNSVQVYEGSANDSWAEVTGSNGTYTFSDGKAYFKVTSTSKYAQVNSITVNYIGTISSTIYSNFCTTVSALSGDLSVATTEADKAYYISAAANVPANETVTINGVLGNTNPSWLIIEDGAQLIQNSSNVMATIEKNITGYGSENTQTRDGYYLIANPTANAVGEEDEYDALDGCTTFDLYTFNPAAALEWVNIGSTSQKVTFERNVGYLFAVPSDRTMSFRGSLLPAGETEITLVRATEGDGRDFPGFNLIGNPYTCNAYVNDYNFYTMVNGELQAAGTSATIAPCEGFFVEATEAGQSVTISTTAPATASQAMSLTVNQNRGNVIDRAIVNFNGSNNLHKFMMNPAHTNLSIAKGGETFAAISTEAEGELPVNFKAEKDGTYTITVNTENVEANYLHLIDNMTGMDTDLLSTPSYTFDAKTSDYASRFKLVFGVKNDNEEMSQASSFAYINNGEIVISNEGRATLQVIDVLGRIVSSEEINGECRISTNGLTAGLYILNLNGMTQKIVVR